MAELRPHAIRPDSGPFSMTMFSPATEDFYFRDDYLVILSPFDVVWAAPVLARCTRSLEAHITFIRDHGIKRAIVVAEDISFLKDCTSLECLEILVPYSAENFDYSPLYEMPNLKELNCQTIHGPKEDRCSHVDYSRISHLERLHVSGARGHQNLSAVHGLRKLYLGQGQPVSKSLTDLDLVSLEVLDLCQSPIRSLEGLERATGLRKLNLTHCRALSGLSALAALNSLTSLEIDACGRIKDFSVLKSLHNLEELVLFGSNTLPDLSFLEQMPKLRSFRFTMNVQDGDLSLCKNVPYVFCKNRKQFNHKNEDLPKSNP